MRKQIGKMIVPLEQSSRDMEIRDVLDTEMAKRSYSRNAGSSSPYLEPKERKTPKHRPQALISIDQYLKTKKGLKQRFETSLKSSPSFLISKIDIFSGVKLIYSLWVPGNLVTPTYVTPTLTTPFLPFQ